MIENPINRQILQTNNNIFPCQTKGSGKIFMIIQPNIDGKNGLYIGGLEGASDLKLLYHYGISSVLTVAALCPISYHNVDRVLFHHVIPVHMESDLSKYFEQSFQFIEQALKLGNLLIHCISGSERAPIYAMAYLMKKHKYEVETAQDFISKKCPFSQPNSGFMKQLLRYEQSLKLDIKYTIRDNHTIQQFSHLNVPEVDQKQKSPNNHMDSRYMNLIDFQKEIKAQEQWLQSFKN